MIGFGQTVRRWWPALLGGRPKSAWAAAAWVVVSAGVLAWNETRAFRRAQVVAEAAEHVVSVDANRVDPANEGRIVHVVGRVGGARPLRDPIFGVSQTGIQLRRTVEVYQWQEHRHDPEPGSGEDATYTYTKAWSQDLAASESFHDTSKINPGQMVFTSHLTTAPRVTVGAFRLSAELVGRVPADRPVPVTEAVHKKLSEQLPRQLRVVEGAYYLPYGLESAAGVPEVGDLRISFRVARPEVVSVIARQAGEVLSLTGAGPDRVAERVAPGRQTAAELLADGGLVSIVWIWVVRVVAWAAVLAGLLMIPGRAWRRRAATALPASLGLAGLSWGLVRLCDRPAAAIALVVAAAGVVVIGLLAGGAPRRRPAG